MFVFVAESAETIVPADAQTCQRAGAGDRFGRFPGMDRLLTNLEHLVPGLREVMVIPGCGHWTQQERPDEVTAAIVDFVRALA